MQDNQKASCQQNFSGLSAEKNIVREIVQKFYDKMLSNPKIAPFFTNTDMDQQREMFCAMLCIGLEGADRYPADKLRHAHKGLELDDEIFDLTLMTFRNVLEEQNIPDPLRANLLRALNKTREDILNR